MERWYEAPHKAKTWYKPYPGQRDPVEDARGTCIHHTHHITAPPLTGKLHPLFGHSQSPLWHGNAGHYPDWTVTLHNLDPDGAGHHLHHHTSDHSWGDQRGERKTDL